MICEHCGKEIDNDTMVCPYCDKPVSAEIQGGEAVKEPFMDAKMKKQSLILAVVCVVAIVCCVVFHLK